MAIIVNIIGRVGTDCEIKTSDDGRNFIRFRFATDENFGGIETTNWMTVSSNSAKSLKMAEYIKKGRLLNVFGTEKSYIEFDKNGKPFIAREIYADRIDFVPSSSKQDREVKIENFVKPTEPITNETKKAPSLEEIFAKRKSSSNITASTKFQKPNDVVLKDDNEETLPF